MHRTRSVIIAVFSAALLAACAERTPPPGVSVDPKTQLFSIHVRDVSRSELLDQLQRVGKVEVRPRPDTDTKLTLDADGLDVDELLARIMPADSRYIARRGDRELAAHLPAGQRKEGPAVAIAAGLVEKGREPKTLAREGGEKRADVELPARAAAAGARTKPAAEKLVANERNEPKKPLPTRVARQSLRVTLLFEQGAAPRVLGVQAIEGGPPAETFVRGPMLYVLLDAGGTPVQFGTFADPLEQHSYLEKEGTHSVTPARSGIAGLSLARDKVASATLQIIDARGLSLPRELDAEAVRGLVARAKPLYTVRGEQLTRLVRQENAQ